MEALDAIYENSTLHLSAPLPLANSTPVKVIIDVHQSDPICPPAGSLDAIYAVLDRGGARKGDAESLDKIYELLDQGAETGIPDLAARHNEHQP